MEALMRARDVANLMNLRVSSIYAMCDRNLIPHVRFTEGRKRALIRFKADEIQAFIENRRKHPVAHDARSGSRAQ